MQIKRKSTAVWNGSGKEGTGNLTSQSGVLSQTQYSANARFADGIGTNPEELIAAAHAGCFSMKLAFLLAAAGFEASEIKTSCEIVFEEGTIIESNLTLAAKIDGISQEKFDEVVADAKANCPVSKVLNAKISVVSSTLN